jgi:hypothetical protein
LSNSGSSSVAVVMVALTGRSYLFQSPIRGTAPHFNRGISRGRARAWIWASPRRPLHRLAGGAQRLRQRGLVVAQFLILGTESGDFDMAFVELNAQRREFIVAPCLLPVAIGRLPFGVAFWPCLSP